MTARPTSGLIKAGAVASVRSFFDAEVTETSDNVHALAECSRTAELLEELAQCQAQIAEHKAALDKAFADGETAGREAAADLFEDNRQEALAKLSDAFGGALASLETQLSVFETLALEASLAALTQLVGDPEDYREILVRTVEQQVRLLGEHTIVSIAVSRLDFPDTSEPAQIAQRLGNAACRVQVSDKLPAGKCEVRLGLGSFEIDLRRSWQEIENVLSQKQSGTEDVE